MHVTITTFVGKNALLTTQNNEQITYPISLLPTELEIGDSCYLYLQVPQDLEAQKARNMRKMLESLIN